MRRLPLEILALVICLSCCSHFAWNFFILLAGHSPNWIMERKLFMNGPALFIPALLFLGLAFYFAVRVIRRVSSFEDKSLLRRTFFYAACSILGVILFPLLWILCLGLVSDFSAALTRLYTMANRMPDLLTAILNRTIPVTTLLAVIFWGLSFLLVARAVKRE
jgi:hypothetical protein